jgi:hypothetical protein
MSNAEIRKLLNLFESTDTSVDTDTDCVEKDVLEQTVDEAATGFKSPGDEFNKTIKPSSKIAISLPKLVEVDDYHELAVLEQMFTALGLKVKLKEVGFYSGVYYGFLYAQLMQILKLHTEKLRLYLKNMTTTTILTNNNRVK